METVTCAHREQITNIERGVDEGVCGVCHQVRQYKWGKQKSGQLRWVCKIVKLGRIDSKIVAPGTEETLELSPEESAELKVARKAPAVNKVSNSLSRGRKQ